MKQRELLLNNNIILQFFLAKMMTTNMFMLVLMAVVIGVCQVLAEPAPPGSVQMRVVNHAGAPIELFWINVFEHDRPLVKQTTKAIRNNTDTTINSYDTHTFMVKYLHDIDGTETEFTKGPKEEVITITADENRKMSANQVTKYDEILMKVQNATQSCANFTGHSFDSCFAGGVVGDVIKLEETKSEITKYRNLMSDRLRNYTCLDDRMESSTPLSSKDVNINGKIYTVDMLFENGQAKIWTVDNFISDAECSVLENHARPLLKRATVASEDGTSVVSENRKAQQAGYDLHINNPNDPLVPLFGRILDLTNNIAGYNLTPEGQEDFTVIQYNPQDQYSPHCDGSCNGDRHNPGGRVATAVLYCKVAERGGATSFTKADIFVKPKKNQATFFSYKGKDGYMEDGFTEHSGCPVIKGEKWITTAWMREGVSLTNSWKIYDPMGVPILDTDAERAVQAQIGVTGGVSGMSAGEL